MCSIQKLRKGLAPSMMAFGLLFTGASFEAWAQDVAPRPTTTGVVTGVNRNSLTIRTEEGGYRVFIFDKNTTKPANIGLGSRVRVTWSPTDDPEVRLADDILVIPPGSNAPTTQPDVVPASVQNVERAIERDFRKFRIGFRAGITLDPETVDIGTHMQVGPIFSRNLFFRPNFEFAYGEVTTLFAINPEFIYNIPFGPRNRRWFYVGGGPGFNFVEQSFGRTSGSNHVDFSNFNYDAALNILLGMQYRSGWFAEVKTSVYASPAPVIRLLVGYTF